MPSSELWAGALSLLLIHHETGCQHSALNAARLLDRIGALDDSSLVARRLAPYARLVVASPALLDRIGALDDLDAETRNLCERASNRLNSGEEPHHAGTA